MKWTDRILLLDVETTGLDATADTIEVAVCLYSVRHASPIASYATLIAADANAAEAINRIPAELLMAEGENARLAWSIVAALAEGAEAFVAHNESFDRAHSDPEVAALLPWIDSMDLDWPRPSSSRALAALALAHDVGIVNAHRAAADVDILARLLTRAAEMGADLGKMLERGLRPRGVFAVADRRFDEARNKIAYEHGFRFDRPTTAWLRTMAIEDAPALPFATRRVS